MTENVKHSPIPFKVKEPQVYGAIQIFDCNGILVAECDDLIGQPRKKNAEFIKTACNYHDQCVSLLEQMNSLSREHFTVKKAKELWSKMQNIGNEALDVLHSITGHDTAAEIAKVLKTFDDDRKERDDWPKHEDGRAKAIGEMTPEEKAAVAKEKK